MGDVKTFLPQLSHCPYCERKLDGEQYVDVLDQSGDSFVSVRKGSTVDPTAIDTYETISCIRFVPCGHAFEKDSVDDITDALQELRRLRIKRKKCESAKELEEYDYKIEAQIHAVNNRVNEAKRRESAEKRKLS